CSPCRQARAHSHRTTRQRRWGPLASPRPAISAGPCAVRLEAQYFEVVVEDDEPAVELCSAPIMPSAPWNLQTNFNSPLAGNLTSVSVSSPGWFTLSALCSASGKLCVAEPSFLSSSSTIWPGLPFRIVGSK